MKGAGTDRYATDRVYCPLAAESAPIHAAVCAPICFITRLATDLKISEIFDLRLQVYKHLVCEVTTACSLLIGQQKVAVPHVRALVALSCASTAGFAAERDMYNTCPSACLQKPVQREHPTTPAHSSKITRN